jgi:hypothetical protein
MFQGLSDLFGKSRFRRLLRVALVIAVILATLHVGASAYAERRLAQARALFAAGTSLTPEDYAPPPLPAGAGNAGDHLEAAVLVLLGQDYEPGRLSPPDADLKALETRLHALELRQEPPTTADLEFFARMLERHKTALSLIDQAFVAGLDERAQVDYINNPFEFELPNYLARLRLIALLRARALLAASEGRGLDAWHDTEAIFQVSTWTAHSMPALMPALLARAIHHQGLLAVQALLPQSAIDAPLRSRILSAATEIDPAAHMKKVIDAERAVVAKWLDFQHFARKRGGFWSSWTPQRRWNTAIYLEHSAKTSESCTRPAWERRGLPAENVDLPFLALAAKEVIFRDCDNVANKRDLWIVDRALLRLAFDLEEWRATTGSLPDSLERLGQVPIDPFSNAPYLYRLKDDGYLLHSIGINGHDDGGILVEGTGFAGSGVAVGRVDQARGDVIFRRR